MKYYREETGSTGVGIGWERSHYSGTTFFYVRILRWHHEWSWPRG